MRRTRRGDAVTRLRGTLAAGLLPRLVREIGDIDVRPVLPGVRLPVLILHGEQDRVIPAAASAELARPLPAARREVIQGMGHLPSPEQLASMQALVDGFLTS